MVKNCENCAGAKDGVGCLDCRAGHTPSRWRPGANYIPPTNGDRIRAMSDEELAEILAVFQSEGWNKCCETFGIEGHHIDGRGDNPDILAWLTQPAQEEEQRETDT